MHSTDEGVAFVVAAAGQSFYYAGDLNWWHWEGESAEYNEQMKTAYQYEIDKLAGEIFDAAFVPLDGRLDYAYSWGCDYFMKQTSTNILFPMHMWGDYTLPAKLKAEAHAADYAERIVMVEREQQSWDISDRTGETDER